MKIQIISKCKLMDCSIEMLYDFKKFYRRGDEYQYQQTGRAININKSRIAIVDIDVGKEHGFTPIDKEVILQDFIISTLFYIQTTSRGYHFYYLYKDMSMLDFYNLYSRNIQMFTCEYYAVDVFLPIQNKRNIIVVIPPSRVFLKNKK